MTDDNLEIIEGPEPGLFMARATRGEHVAEHLLPRGFHTWERAEIESHLRRFVAPELRTKIERLAAGIAKPEPVTDADVIKIEAAREKRAMRTAKLASQQRAKGEPDGPE